MWKTVGLFLVFITISACATYHPAVQKTQKRFYIVKEKDNFHSIAFAFEISTDQLQSANPWLNPQNIAPGMRLSIPDVSFGSQIIQPGQKTDFTWPLERVDVSSEFGYRNGDLHAGIDLRAPWGTEIYASADGLVVFSGRMNGYGRVIVINHGNAIETVYAHNDRNSVEAGQQVKQGQVVGRVGKSGNASGYHLHFEVRRMGKAVNPVNYLNTGL